MAGGLACWFLILFSGFACADLREKFYNQLRELIYNRPSLKESRPQEEDTRNNLKWMLKADEEVAERPHQVAGWRTGLASQIGQVSGVAVNSLGQPVIFHRGHRTWDITTFNRTHHFQKVDDGPIELDTVVTIDPEYGTILSSWGAGMFFLPHGITIDHRNNTWLTDVGLHQVLKFPVNWTTPTLILGERFNPGRGLTQFCKPTSVAIATNGEIFVADGYCNSRIMKFSHIGKLRRIFPYEGEFLSLVIPHSVSLIEERDLLCVADRENMRVVCFKAEIGRTGVATRLSPLTIHQPDLGRVFAIAARGDFVYAVNGPTSSHIPVQGFTLDPFSEAIIDHWAPDNEGFSEPHDIAISPKGDALYVAELGPINKLWKFKFHAV